VALPSINGKVFQDRFGIRSVGIDQENGEAVDVLSFVPGLAGAPGFGEAVSERTARLARVRHAMYARVRRVVRSSDDSLLLLSDRVEGWRLSTVLAIMEREGALFDISAVLVLLRQLIPAVALFSRHQRDATIGTIAPERLILTPQGRLVIAEFVLSPGLEQLQFSRERLWRDYRVAVPPNANPARIPPSADVVGIGIVALSLLVGRMLREDEYLVSLGDLVESATEIHVRTPRKLSSGFATWLARMLQFDEHNALRTPQEAQIAFEEMLAKERSYVTTPTELDAFIAKYSSHFDAASLTAEPTRGATGATGATGAAGATGALGRPSAAPRYADIDDAQTQPDIALLEQLAVATSEVAVPRMPALEASAPVAPIAPVAPVAPVAPRVAGSPRWRLAAAAAAVLVVGQAAVIGWLLNRDGAGLGDSGELVVQSRPVAARVTIDGDDHGITPLTTELPAGSHVLEVRVGKSEPRVIPVTIRPGVQSGIYVELQSVATVGGLEVRSAPATAKVSVAGQYRGTTPLVLKDLPPGDIEVLLQSGSRQVRQTVRIEPGITSQLVVPLDR
jgi:hypothetical protein